MILVSFQFKVNGQSHTSVDKYVAALCFGLVSVASLALSYVAQRGKKTQTYTKPDIHKCRRKADTRKCRPTQTHGDVGRLQLSLFTNWEG
jgi:hypothetical protein